MVLLRGLLLSSCEGFGAPDEDDAGPLATLLLLVVPASIIVSVSLVFAIFLWHTPALSDRNTYHGIAYY
jgi:hypothetical protein